MSQIQLISAVFPAPPQSLRGQQREGEQKEQHETQRMVRRKRREAFIRTNASCNCAITRYSNAFRWPAWPCCRVVPLVLCVRQRLVQFRDYWEACFATRRRRP